MKYGDWQLRDTSAYYKSQNIILYPSSNSSDTGAINLETNLRNISRRIARKSYKLHDSDFFVTRNADNKSVTISAGEASIQGYHLITNTSISIKLPTESTEVTSWTLGISLSYDAANNVTGDVINNSLAIGENELFSGVYVDFFDECQLRSNYDNILVLARIWEKGGSIIDKTYVNGGDYDGRYIDNGIQQDPVNNHRIYSSDVELTINGAKLNHYDAIQNNYINNLSDISMYDSVKYPVEQDNSQYTKPPTFTTDIQDYANFATDWYTCKYGDYMTGALRFDNLSIDAKIKLDPDHAEEYLKDTSLTTTGKYHNTEGVIISPRFINNLTRRNVRDLGQLSSLYRDGGTIMSIVPQSFEDGINTSTTALDGVTPEANGAYSALVSQSNGDIGTIIKTFNGARSRISMPSNLSSGLSTNTHLYIENTGNPSYDINNANTDLCRIKLDKGRGYFTTYSTYSDAGFQFVANGSSDTTSSELAFRFERNRFIASNYNIAKKESFEQPIVGQQLGVSSDTMEISAGVGCSYYGNLDTSTTFRTSPYLAIGNLLLHSTDPTVTSSSVTRNNTNVNFNDKLNTIRVMNVNNSCRREYGIGDYPLPAYRISGDNLNGKNEEFSPYVRILPGTYTQESVVEDFLQVGVSKQDDVLNAHALDKTFHKIIIGKNARTDDSSNGTDICTFLEQTNKCATLSSPSIFNKLCSSGVDDQTAIYGIYSKGNIGCSNMIMRQGSGHDIGGWGQMVTAGPYTSDSEYVRFTQYRYDKDNDKSHGGANNPDTDGHALTKGTPYNIEFNTTLANQRANQIIWRYKGAENRDNQPVTLSYIHDEKPTVTPEGNRHGTIYPDETYYDHNMYLHQNPTYGVRDFLRIDGAGLSVHGDINNPTLSGDTNNNIQHLGITLLQGRIYSSTYNDYAETYEKSNSEEQSIEGMVVALDAETGKYKICDQYASQLVVGVISDYYGMLIGGKTIDSAEDHIDSVSQKDNFAVGVAGKVFVNVDTESIHAGDLLISSKLKGLATVCDVYKPGTVIGKALSAAQKVPNTNYYKCLMQIMLA